MASVASFNDLIGLPYKERGRTLAGADCWGLVVLAFRHLKNISLPSYDEDYRDICVGTRAEIAELIRKERAAWTPVEEAEVRPFDCVSLLYGGDAMHIGIVVERGKMLHMPRTPGKGAVVERYTSPMWRPRIQGFYRYVV